MNWNASLLQYSSSPPEAKEQKKLKLAGLKQRKTSIDPCKQGSESIVVDHVSGFPSFPLKPALNAIYRQKHS